MSFLILLKIREEIDNIIGLLYSCTHARLRVFHIYMYVLYIRTCVLHSYNMYVYTRFENFI